MRVLFLFQRFSFESSTIYLDLVRECVKEGHEVYILAGTSDTGVFDDGRARIGSSFLTVTEGCRVVYVLLPDQFKSGRIKKGLVQLLIEPFFLRALMDNIWSVKLDLIAYPTPPITLAGVVSKAKAHYGAVTYLMLKDIFPQNAADLDMMGSKSLVFRYFKNMESRLYDVSDRIGCMSDANVRYMFSHNPDTESKLELFPNTVSIRPACDIPQKISSGRKESISFMLGGNLGEPQAVDILMEGMKQLSQEGFKGARFMIVGDGTRAEYVRDHIEKYGLDNAEYHRSLSRNEYEALLAEQDVGIISLSSSFTIPNFPSRLLSYMQVSKPVLVVADSITDIGDVVVNRAQCGFFVSSADPGCFVKGVKEVCKRADELELMGRLGREYLEKHFDVRLSVKLLEKAIGD